MSLCIQAGQPKRGRPVEKVGRKELRLFHPVKDVVHSPKSKRSPALLVGAHTQPRSGGKRLVLLFATALVLQVLQSKQAGHLVGVACVARSAAWNSQTAHVLANRGQGGMEGSPRKARQTQPANGWAPKRGDAAPRDSLEGAGHGNS